MTTMTTPTIEVGEIDVAEGFNARTSMEADGIACLAASIGTDGVVQPLLVKRRRARVARP